MALIGAVVGGVLPGIAGRDASDDQGPLGRVRWSASGCWSSGTLVFFLLLSGFDGA